MIWALIRAMRPRQWIKNGFIFAALVFDGQLFAPDPFLRTTIGFVLLCAASSAVYLMNDIVDLEADRRHPTKRLRPLASGALSVGIARVAAAVLLIVAVVGGWALEPAFGVIVVAYLAMNALYSYWLKHVAIIDVFIIAAGFLLRVGGGVSLITVERFSPWLYVCTSLLALFIGFGKRRAEIVLLAESANTHRRVLDGYSVGLLDQIIQIVSALAIMSYSLYTFSAENLPENHLMMLTIPFVIYGIFRYLHLIHVEGKGGAPEELVLRDRPLMATLILWALSSTAVLYLGA
ncbi:MAG: decaprenyl-phosphate phosphoribosyltransferase [Anaerolineales bacterium]|nr:decaprenyl-phosphate phosphoribosyltransferase [Anaerolineales bacterium]